MKKKSALVQLINYQLFNSSFHSTQISYSINQVTSLLNYESVLQVTSLWATSRDLTTGNLTRLAFLNASVQTPQSVWKFLFIYLLVFPSWFKVDVTLCNIISRVQFKCDGTRWRTGGEVKGKLANGVGSQYSSHYLGTWCILHYYHWCAHFGCQ